MVTTTAATAASSSPAMATLVPIRCRPTSCAPCAATTRPVSTTAWGRARAARASSSAPCRRTPSTCASPTRTARWTSDAATAVNTVASRSASPSAWSKRSCAPTTSRADAAACPPSPRVPTQRSPPRPQCHTPPPPPPPPRIINRQHIRHRVRQQQQRQQQHLFRPPSHSSHSRSRIRTLSLHNSCDFSTTRCRVRRLSTSAR